MSRTACSDPVPSDVKLGSVSEEKEEEEEEEENKEKGKMKRRRRRRREGGGEIIAAWQRTWHHSHFAGYGLSTVPSFLLQPNPTMTIRVVL